MNEADVLAILYEDTCTVVRSSNSTDNDGFDTFGDTIPYENIPCGVDFSRGSTTGLEDVAQPISYLAELYVRPEVDIRAGDKITATVQGRVYKFTAGEGVYYPSHGQIPLIREDKA